MLKRNPHTNQIIRPDWFMYLFGGVGGYGQMPESQGGGYYWNANLYRRYKRWDGVWKKKYTLREWLRVGGMDG